MNDFEFNGGFADIAVSTRVRLARNIKGYNYKDENIYEEIATKVFDAIKTAPVIAQKLELIKIEQMSENALAMVELHQISPQLAKKGGYIIKNNNGSISIMIGDEDHIRLQIMGSGFCPKECLQEAKRLVALIEEHIKMDYDEKLGYLTACPSNLGTGLRASVMLHLPMLENSISELVNIVGRQGFTIRGAYGEGSSATGGFYQLSNQTTLGMSEQSIIERLIDICTNVMQKEKNILLSNYENILLQDSVCRALGNLKTARVIQTKEAIDFLGKLFIGVSIGYIKGIEPKDIWQTEQRIFPNVLGGTQNERDIKRAEILRNLTKNAKIEIK